MIKLERVSLQRGLKRLLEESNLTLFAGQKVGIIGENGVGKSSLFALLTQELTPDLGEVLIPKQLRIAHLAQEVPALAQTAIEYVIEGDKALCALEKQLSEAHDGIHIAELYARMEAIDAYTAHARAAQLMYGLGFSRDEQSQRVSQFSGGWRMRLNLARTLMCPSDLLLLDEPTNHLDLDALVWLEAWLKRYEGTMIVISHDREFLDAVTDVTIHIDNAQITRYGGNYSKFEDLRAQQLELQQASFAKQQEKIAHLKKFIDRFKAKASKAKQAQSRVKALDRMEKIAPVLADAEFTFEFKEPTNLPNPMLAITDASFGY